MMRESFLITYNNFIDELKKNAKENKKVSDLYLAAIYQLENPGKLLRPTIMVGISNDISLDYSEIENFALALELIHNYSLIHDDLPSMDNDDYRRGKLTLHKKYNEALAILTGDFLLNKAFEVVTRNKTIDTKNYFKSINYLSTKTCDYGMLGGQVMDMKPLDLTTYEELIKMYEYKTSALFQIAFVIPGILAGFKDEDLLVLENIGRTFGIYFQIRDDIYDQEEDKKEGKKTIFDFKKEDEIQRIVNKLKSSIINDLNKENLTGTAIFIEGLL